MNTVEKRNQIIAMLYQNMDKVNADETLKLIDELIAMLVKNNAVLPHVSGSFPTVNDIHARAKKYFDSLCINQKSYLYPTKGFIEGAMWMRELAKGNDR